MIIIMMIIVIMTVIIIITVNNNYDSNNNNNNHGKNNDNGNNNNNINNNNNNNDNNNNNNNDNNNNNNNNSNNKNDNNIESHPIYSNMDILGLDLGAGTGLACIPIKTEINKKIKKSYDRLKEWYSNDRSNNSNDSNDDINNNNNNNNNDNNHSSNNGFLPPFIGILAVDLSPKMLQRSNLKNCYGDMIVSDVVQFVREYSENVRIIRENRFLTERDENETENVGGRKIDEKNVNNHKNDYKNDNENDNENENKNRNNLDEKTKENQNLTSSSVAEEEKEKEGSHPLLDFITAADVFMYLGDVTYGLCSSVLYWIGLDCIV